VLESELQRKVAVCVARAAVGMVPLEHVIRRRVDDPLRVEGLLAVCTTTVKVEEATDDEIDLIAIVVRRPQIVGVRCDAEYEESLELFRALEESEEDAYPARERAKPSRRWPK
jgi:hypothetical protein